MNSWATQDVNAVLAVARSADGQNFIMQLLVMSGLFEVNNNCNQMASAFIEGRRSMGIDILNMLENAEPVKAGHFLKKQLGKTGAILESLFKRINSRRTEIKSRKG